MSDIDLSEVLLNPQEGEDEPGLDVLEAGASTTPSGALEQLQELARGWKEGRYTAEEIAVPAGALQQLFRSAATSIDQQPTGGIPELKTLMEATSYNFRAFGDAAAGVATYAAVADEDGIQLALDIAERAAEMLLMIQEGTKPLMEPAPLPEE